MLSQGRSLTGGGRRREAAGGFAERTQGSARGATGRTPSAPLSHPTDAAQECPPVTPRSDRPRERGIPEATVARLPIYLRALQGLSERGLLTVSSEDLARIAGVNSAKLRKDLSHLGSYGTRGVGYEVEYLVYQIARELGLTQDWAVAIVGAGNLGRALANYGGFGTRGFRIAALLDADERLVGGEVAGLRVGSIDLLEDVVTAENVSIGVIAVPAVAAQSVCDRFVEAGVTSVLNFAPMVLDVPSAVDVRKVDLSIELQILAFHAQRKAEGGPSAGPGLIDAEEKA